MRAFEPVDAGRQPSSMTADAKVAVDLARAVDFDRWPIGVRRDQTGLPLGRKSS
jgi:hypothetical protein